MRLRGQRVRIRIETPPVSWLGGIAPKFQGLLDEWKQQRDLPIPAANLGDSLRETVARAENFRLTVARRRRLFTVFPCAESPVIVDGDRKIAIAACSVQTLATACCREKIAGP